MAGAVRPDQRPIAPHLSVWRWHVTMLVSILHRVTGGALYVGMILFGLWLMLIAAGPEAYDWVFYALSSWWGQTGLYLLVGAIAFHLAQGVRHLVFDTGRGLGKIDASTSAWFAIFFAFIVPLGLWALLTFGV